METYKDYRKAISRFRIQTQVCLIQNSLSHSFLDIYSLEWLTNTSNLISPKLTRKLTNFLHKKCPSFSVFFYSEWMALPPTWIPKPGTCGLYLIYPMSRSNKIKSIFGLNIWFQGAYKSYHWIYTWHSHFYHDHWACLDPFLFSVPLRIFQTHLFKGVPTLLHSIHSLYKS